MTTWCEDERDVICCEREGEREGETEEEDEGGNLGRRRSPVPSVGQITDSSAHFDMAFPFPGPRKGGGVAPFIKPLNPTLYQS